MYWLLFYDVVDDYVERRAPLRGDHFDLLRATQDAGHIVLAGALADPVDGAVIVFRGDDPSVAEDFVANDPYVKAGLVTSWRIREWTVVAGDALPPA